MVYVVILIGPGEKKEARHLLIKPSKSSMYVKIYQHYEHVHVCSCSVTKSLAKIAS